MFAAGAFAAAGAAALDVSVTGQALIFAIVSVLSLLVVRPAIRRHLKRRDVVHPMGLDAIEGASALVLEDVDAERGLIKIEGELWSARSYQPDQMIPAGSRVRVIEINGATAMVWRD